MKIVRIRRGNLWLLLVLIILLAYPPIVFAEGNFVTARLPHGVQIEIPRNWEVLSANKRITLDTAVQSRNENAGLFYTSSDLNFAANCYTDAGKTIAVLNFRYYPDFTITQREARAFTQADTRELDVALRDSMRQNSKIYGVSVLAWHGTKKQIINGATAFVTEYKRSPVNKNGIFLVRLVRIINAGKSFTLTVSYRIDQEYLMKPICDRIISSLRI